MSRMSRPVVIKLVITTIPQYYMQTALLPKTTTQQLERICRNFLWGDTENKAKLHPFNWNTVCTLKDKADWE